MRTIDLYTIGFTKKSARDFFSKLQASGVKRVLDVRLTNASQLSGFAKKNDLAFFLERLHGIEYHHLTALAPTKEMLDAYKKHKGDWSVYADQFLDLMTKRRIEDQMDRDIMDGGCLLCSEHKPHHCHRRLVAEYLQDKWNEKIRVTHLV